MATHHVPPPTQTDSVVARVKTGAQAFWTVVVQALALFAMDRLGVDLGELSVELLAALVAVTTPIVAVVLMTLVDFVGKRWPIVKRLWIFVSDPVYEVPPV